MRIPGLGGEVLKKVGGIPVALTGGDLFTSLQSGAIDATEWVGPYMILPSVYIRRLTIIITLAGMNPRGFGIYC